MLTNNTTDLTCKVGNGFPLEGTRFYFALQRHITKGKNKSHCLQVTSSLMLLYAPACRFVQQCQTPSENAFTSTSVTL